MFTRILIIVTLVLGMGMGAVSAGERGKPIPIKRLPGPLRAAILEVLEGQGIKPSGRVVYASDGTAKCPSNCNDSSGGGYCFCSPDSEGKCPSGTEKAGSPGDEYCRVSMPKGVSDTGVVYGGNLPSKVTIEW